MKNIRELERLQKKGWLIVVWMSPPSTVVIQGTPEGIKGDYWTIDVAATRLDLAINQFFHQIARIKQETP